MARRLLADAWPACNTRERLRFLRALGPEVAPDDEPLLEQALDDRAHQVRREAIAQLARLPGSAFAARMAARAVEILDYAGEGETGRFHVASTLPEDAEMSRDGLRKTNGESKLRSWQLVNVISATPLSLWTEKWRTSPEAIVAALTHGDQRQQLLPAFVLAARNQRDAAWAAPLLRFLGRRFWGRIDNYDLIGVLPRTQQETFFDELVAQHSRRPRPRPLHRTSPVLAVLSYLDRPWSPGLARTVLSYVAEGLQADPGRHRPDAMRQKAVHDLGRWLPVDLASADFDPIRSAVADRPWLDTVDQMVATWQLRREVARAFYVSEEQEHE